MSTATPPSLRFSEEASLYALRVSDIMTVGVRVAHEGDTLRHVRGLMKMGGIRHVPIVDEDGKLSGVVSDRDVHLAWHAGPTQTAASFMTTNVHWAHPDALARDVAARMMNEKIGCLPVVDAAGQVIGIVTATDFLRVAHRALTFQEAWAAQ